VSPEPPRERQQAHGWCSLRLRFEERELELLRGAEQLRGFALAQKPRPDVLRTALNLAKVGHKLSSAAPSASIVLEEGEVGLLLEALRFALPEVQWATRTPENERSPRRDAVLTAFPELNDRGGWRSFGLIRELETVAARLQTALNS
jgi:hypothetical protein